MGNSQTSSPYDTAIRREKPHWFPKEFITTTTEEHFANILTYTDAKRDYSKLSLSQYKADFEKHPSRYDLHERNFQNFALSITKALSSEEKRKLSSSRHHSDKRLLRDDLNWKGEPIAEDDEEDKNKKRTELRDQWLSCKLYDWSLAPQEELQSIENTIKNHEDAPPCPIRVLDLDTQTAVEEAFTKYPNKKICWLDLANAHNTLGTYNVSFGGSQEEHVVPNSSAAVTLGLHAVRETDSMRARIQGEHHILYRDGWHIPPGGNYFTKSIFVTSEPQVQCYMIATAFADFRQYLPVFRPNSERSEYVGMFGNWKDLEKVKERLRIDIEGTLKTALREGMDVLILGAGGCGAFRYVNDVDEFNSSRHDAWFDAKIWKEVLEKYRRCFIEIIFAILPDKRNASDNFTAFKQTLHDETVHNETVHQDGKAEE